VVLGQIISKNHFATSMIDISDGLLIDTQHILKESNVGAQIWEEEIPISSLYSKWIHYYSNDFYKLAETGGEDYELLFTAPPYLRDKISELSRSQRVPITRIGQILPKKDGFFLIKKDGSKYYPDELGFEHFK
jgi:thiamine-monophosphate kinase